MSTITVTTDQGISFQFLRFFGAGTSQGSGTLRCADGDSLVFFGAGATYSNASFFESVGGRPVEWATITGFSVPWASLEDPGVDGLQSTLGNILFRGGAGNDLVVLGGGSDTIYGGAGNDTLVGNYAGTVDNDALYGGAGNDVLIGTVGSDYLSGGAGFDTVDLRNAFPGGGMTIDLRLTSWQQVNDTGDLPYGLSLRLSSVENVEGSEGNDRITGNSVANTLKGYAGNDTLIGGFGNDVLVGGEGFDTADYSAFASSTVRLSSTGVQTVGQAGRDQLMSIEALIGGKGADVFVGDAAANVLAGGGGNDSLNGGSGNDSILGGSGRDMLIGGIGSDTLAGEAGDDVIDGGAGADFLVGGADADRFVFRSVAEANGDFIVDFIGSQGDRLDLRLIDANTGAGGDQAFAFIGASGFTGAAGQLRYQTTSPNPGTPVFIQGDTNGDGQAEFQITLQPGFPFPVVADFLL